MYAADIKADNISRTNIGGTMRVNPYSAWYCFALQSSPVQLITACVYKHSEKTVWILIWIYSFQNIIYPGSAW